MFADGGLGFDDFRAVVALFLEGLLQDSCNGYVRQLAYLSVAKFVIADWIYAINIAQFGKESTGLAAAFKDGVLVRDEKKDRVEIFFCNTGLEFGQGVLLFLVSGIFGLYFFGVDCAGKGPFSHRVGSCSGRRRFVRIAPRHVSSHW